MSKTLSTITNRFTGSLQLKEKTPYEMEYIFRSFISKWNSTYFQSISNEA